MLVKVLIPKESKEHCWRQCIFNRPRYKSKNECALFGNKPLLMHKGNRKQFTACKDCQDAFVKEG